jgi:Chromo (CHRromatin Organisation MOdifier) domain
MHPVFHVSALRPYCRDGPYQPPPLPEYIDEYPEWEVSHIADVRRKGKKLEYRIAWQGLQDKDTWEPEENLTNCPDKLREFWEHRKSDGPATRLGRNRKRTPDEDLLPI